MKWLCRVSWRGELCPFNANWLCHDWWRGERCPVNAKFCIRVFAIRLRLDAGPNCFWFDSVITPSSTRGVTERQIPRSCRTDCIGTCGFSLLVRFKGLYSALGICRKVVSWQNVLNWNLDGSCGKEVAYQDACLTPTICELAVAS